jgi:hypothetical protein
MQGVEVAMYTAWYLAESFQTIKFINTLLKEKVFYIVMTISPDGRKILFINRINRICMKICWMIWIMMGIL